MLDPVCTTGLLHEADHPLDSRDRIVLEPEREREIEHRLGVGRPFDEAEVRVVDGVLQLALDEMEVADEPVVHPEPVRVAERMRVRLLDRRARRGADMGEEER